MKLRTKLKISFCILIVLPILLCCVIISMLVKLQARSISEDYQVENMSVIGTIYTPITFLSQITNTVYSDMIATMEDNPNVLNNKTYLNELSGELKERLSSLIVRKNGTIMYSSSSMQDDELYEMLPAYGDLRNNTETGSFYGGDYQSLIKQIDFKDGAGNYYSVSIVTSVTQMLPQIKLFISEGILAIVLVLFSTSAILMMWIYRSVIRPLARLKLATQNIKEGNLDFELPIEGKDEICDLCRDFEEMRVILKASAEDKVRSDQEEKELIRNISHDLKTPLTAIKGYVEGLMDGVAVTEEKQEKYLKTIFNKVNDMDRLINELTIYSRIDTNRIPYTFKKIDVTDYFDDCCYEIGVELESKGFELEYINHIRHPLMIVADAEQLKRVINNIVSNSIKYAADRKGHITIELFEEQSYAYVKIGDNGKGIGKEDLAHIFDRFYRADSSRNSKQGGSGIGLAIVKKIIDDHGGKIWATSEVDVGTTMHLKLKKYCEDEPQEQKRAIEEADIVPDKKDSRKLKWDVKKRDNRKSGKTDQNKESKKDSVKNKDNADSNIDNITDTDKENFMKNEKESISSSENKDS